MTETAELVECDECAARIRASAQFCPSCGMRRDPDVGGDGPAPAPEADAAPAASAAEEAPAASAADAAPAASVAEQAPAAPPGPGVLLPALPFRLLWSPRKPWRVITRLDARAVAEVFESTMTKSPSLLARMNAYYRKVRWSVGRNAISGDLTATCRSAGRIGVGWGWTRRYVDPSGDTIECSFAGDRADGSTEVLIGPGAFSTYFGMYLYPPTSYPVAVVKALRRADPSAAVAGYPWSLPRIVGWAAVALAIASIALGG